MLFLLLNNINCNKTSFSFNRNQPVSYISQFLVSNILFIFTVYITNIKISTKSSCVNEVFITLKLYLIKQPKSKNFKWSLIHFLFTSLQYFCFMDLSVMPTYKFFFEILSMSFSFKVFRDNERIGNMRFFNVVMNTIIFRNIAKSHTNIWE